jgi:hypothetical protein
MKKPKTLEVKLRSAIRLIWSRSAERRAAIKAATIEIVYNDAPTKGFVCPLCGHKWPIWAGEVDHIDPVGPLDLSHVTEFVRRMFYSPQQTICKLCHKKKTAEQRRKK